jgi:5-methylcytosine-specific restriction enzyme A
MWRTTPLPPEWPSLRKAALQRDEYRCTWFPGGSVQGWDYAQSYTHPYRCTAVATDVDHIGNNNDHSLHNLRSLCKQHHSSKTSSFAHRTMNERNKSQAQRNAGKGKKHPGLV